MEGIPNCFETVLMEDNHRYLLSIATLKSELKEACHEYESLSKNVKMLTSGTQGLQNILNDRKSISNKMRLGYFVEKLQWMTILATIIKDIATFKKNYKYSKTITDRLVSLIDFIWYISDRPIFATWSISDKPIFVTCSISDRLISLIEFDKFCYIYKFFKIVLYT